MEVESACPCLGGYPGPSVVAQYADGQVASGVYSDGRPRALHTYNGSVWVAAHGCVITHENALANSGGASSFGRAYIINPTTGAATFKAGFLSATDAGGSGCHDTTRPNVVWRAYHGSGAFRKHDLQADTITAVGSAHGLSGNLSLTHMPDSDCILVGHGDPLASTNSGWKVFDCVTGTFYSPTFTGGNTPGSAHANGWPGSCQPSWDAVQRCAWVWDMNTGHTTKLMKLTPGANPRTDAWTVTEVTATGGVTPTPRLANGTYGRAFLWPSKSVFIVINAVTQSGYFYRMN
jgi:hypothetical protein